MPWYISSEPNEEISIYYADFDHGIPVKLGNGADTEGMEFGISREGISFFVGLWRGNIYIISKEDFYIDRYEMPNFRNWAVGSCCNEKTSAILSFRRSNAYGGIYAPIQLQTKCVDFPTRWWRC